ncbi:hypothetical protein SETIT_9G361100v2 [Setaria italica]|uniref:Myb-like domain-containing protein n=1 Tax=Setaria italica TaxID=4555 RepID=K4A912_SETIT|nr:uncharacterized protein LOC101779464 [Setaria italica]RCV44283.1 hypothetical protein SETIT_9G361100v2 [Setaria italica]
MLFTHEKNADQFDRLSYGNLRGLDASGNSEESSFGNGCKDSSSVPPEKFGFPWLPVENCQSATLDHDKRPLSDVKPCQVACKRPKQTDHNTWLYSLEECPFTSETEISASALADELVETKQPDHIPGSNGATTCSVSSGIPCPNHEQSVGVENLQLPDWVTSFPSYFEDWGTVAGYNQVGDIDSPVHEYLPRKCVPIGPEHQADIPEWRPRVSVSVTGGSGFCADLDCSSVSTSEPVSRGYDFENAKWIRDCVIPISSCSSPVDWVGDNKADCECSDEGSVRCARQHIIEARESLKMSLGHDKFCELGLCEMGEDIAQRWTDEEEKRFQRVVFSNSGSLGKNFWDHLPLAFPDKTSKDLVSYYFNVFMLRKRAQQNRSDLLHVDSDDDELHGESSVACHEEEDSAVESPKHEHFIDNSLPIEGDHKEYGGEHITGPSFHECTSECRHLPNQMHLYSNAKNIAQNVYDQDELRASFEGQHNGAHTPKGVQCAEFS